MVRAASLPAPRGVFVKKRLTIFHGTLRIYSDGFVSIDPLDRHDPLVIIEAKSVKICKESGCKQIFPEPGGLR